MQRILLDLSSHHPEKELFAFLLAFERPRKNMLAMVTHAGAPLRIPGDSLAISERLRKMRNFSLSQAEQTALIEACLIGYFKPKYNIQYQHFDKRGSKVLRDVRSAGFSAVAVSLDNENIANQRVGSSLVPPSAEHRIQVPLRKDLPWPFGKR